MIELSFLIFQILIFFTFFSVNILRNFEKNFNRNDSSLTENIAFSFVVQANLILILSILNLNIKNISIIYLLIIFSLYFFVLKKNFNNLKFLYKYYFFEFFIIFLISSAIFIDISNKLIISWDTQNFWIFKTLNFFNQYSIENLQNISRPHYPFLGSLLSSLYWKLSFIDHEYSGRLFFGFLYTTSLFLLINNLSLTKVSKLIFLFLFLIITYDYFLLFSGNQEIFIFSIICITMNSFYKIKIDAKKNFFIHSIIILLSCNLLMWIKQEGMFYAFFLIITLFYLKKSNLNIKILYSLVIILFLIFKLSVFKFYNLEISLNKSVISSLDYRELLLKITYERILEVIKFFLFAPFQSYFLLIGIIFYFLNKLNKTKIKYLEFYIIINFLFIFFVYLFIDNQVFNLKTGIDRLIFNISPFIILLTIELVNKKIKDQSL